MVKRKRRGPDCQLMSTDVGNPSAAQEHLQPPLIIDPSAATLCWQVHVELILPLNWPTNAEACGEWTGTIGADGGLVTTTFH